jgi:hypothetical protein
VSPVRYELCLYIPEDGIINSHGRENLKSYIAIVVVTLIYRSHKHTDLMKNGVFWDVTPCGSCKNRRFGGTWRLLHQGDKNR